MCETYTLNYALDGHLESSLDISYIRGRQISSNSSTGCTGRWDARTVQRNSHLYFLGEISTGQSLPFKLGSAVRNGKDDQRFCSTHWTLPCPKKHLIFSSKPLIIQEPVPLDPPCSFAKLQTKSHVAARNPPGLGTPFEITMLDLLDVFFFLLASFHWW